MITLNTTTNTLTISSKILKPVYNLVRFSLELTNEDETISYIYYGFCNKIVDTYKLDSGVISKANERIYTYKLRCEYEMEVGILTIKQ